MTYKGYTISKGKDDNYWITPPNALQWKEPAVNLKTAKKWVDAHLIERNARFPVFERMKPKPFDPLSASLTTTPFCVMDDEFDRYFSSLKDAKSYAKGQVIWKVNRNTGEWNEFPRTLTVEHSWNDVERSYWYGHLNHKNADKILVRIRKLLVGNLFSIANCNNFDSREPQLHHSTNCRLNPPDWTDGDKEQLRLSRYKEIGSVNISFSTNGYVYFIDSQWTDEEGTTPRSTLDGKHERSSTDAYMVFQHNAGFSWYAHAPSGNLCYHTFVVQGPIPATNIPHENRLR